METYENELTTATGDNLEESQKYLPSGTRYK